MIMNGLLLFFSYLYNMQGLKSLKLNSFSLQAEKDLKAKAFTASLNGKGEIFEVNAEFKLEYAAAGIQATFDAKANDDAGVKLSTHLPWLKNIPVCFFFHHLKCIAAMPRFVLFLSFTK